MSNQINDILLFFSKKVINNMAPLSFEEKYKKEIYELENIECNSIKYPYKPFLLLSIANAFKQKPSLLFNSEINLHNELIIKLFYDFITSDNILFSILKNHSSKQNWEIGFNQKIKESVFSIMLQGPIKKLSSKWFLYDNKKKTLKFNFDVEPSNENFLLFEQSCYEAIKKAIPWYKKMPNNQILNLLQYYEMEYMTHDIDTKIEGYARRYQHIFRKNVLDRDKKCLICCTDNNSILQACHIKPYSNSQNFEKYDFNNGITLCANHHTLFDKGYFSFDQNWKLIVSKHVNNIDDDLFFRQYEECYKNMLNNFPSMNDYTKYHFEKIFLK